MIAPAGRQFLGGPLLERLAEPGLGDSGEVDDPAAAAAELPTVFHMSLRCSSSGDDPASMLFRLLQVAQQRPVISVESGRVVEAGDCRGAA